MGALRPIPDATVGRLPLYLRALTEWAASGETTVSSSALASASGVNPAKVRKDLSYLGSYGTRGVGYDVAYLLHQVRRELGLTQDWPVAIVGIGNLGRALAGYRGFAQRGFSPAALFDSDPRTVGQVLGGMAVRHVSELGAVVREQGIAIAVISTPASVAQEIADVLVAAGVRSILNFAPVVLSVPDDVVVRKVDLAQELQILTYYEQRTAAVEQVRARRARRAVT